MKRRPLSCFEVPVIGGALKGKKILIPDVATTRSSKSILRESLFDTLQFEIMDAHFVEVFAGSGSVGIEALSRGAAHGYFLEHNREVLAILRENTQRLAPERSTVIPGDSFERFGPLHDELVRKGVATYFYFDPPFSVREGMEEIYERTLSLIGMIDPAVCRRVIVEHMSPQALPDTIGELRRIRQKRFGKSTLSYYAPEGTE